jgi:hypothetical protein
MENFYIQGLRDVNEANMSILSRNVLRMLQANEPGWEQMVPEQVGALIKVRRLLGFGGSKSSPEAETKGPDEG